MSAVEFGREVKRGAAVVVASVALVLASGCDALVGVENLSPGGDAGRADATQSDAGGDTATGMDATGEASADSSSTDASLDAGDSSSIDSATTVDSGSDSVDSGSVDSGTVGEAAVVDSGATAIDSAFADSNLADVIAVDSSSVDSASVDADDACVPVTHSTGNGATWTNCEPLGTYNETEAIDACQAYEQYLRGMGANSTFSSCTDVTCGSGTDTVELQITENGNPAVAKLFWTYVGPFAGYLAGQGCPNGSDPMWN